MAVEKNFNYETVAMVYEIQVWCAFELLEGFVYGFHLIIQDIEAIDLIVYDNNNLKVL